MKEKWYSLTGCALVVTIAFVFISFFSPTTSPFYNNDVESLDSDMFQVFGKNWANGGSPYITVWDQKGPVIFFINMLGYLIFDSKIGVWLLQILSLSITFYFVFRFLREEYSVKFSIILTFLSTFALLNNYSDDGNCVEEYILPFMVPAFWLLYKWTKSISFHRYTDHSSSYAILYGFVFAFALLTRLTNALGICCASGFIFFYLLFKHEEKNLVFNILGFISGFLVLFLPFALYFLIHGTFGEMWYATFTYNVDYAHNAPQLVTFSFHQWLYLFKSAITGILFIFVAISVVIFNPNRRLAGWLWIAVGLTSMGWLITSNGFNHYFIITFPYYCIILDELHCLWNRYRAPILKKLIVAYPLVLILACTYEIYVTYKTFTSTNANISFYEKVRKNIQSNPRQTFLAYNNSTYIYLYLDRQPGMRFFTYQSNQIQFSETLLPKLRKSFLEEKPYWVLVGYKPNEILSLLNKYYVVSDRYDNGQVLWKRKY